MDVENAGEKPDTKNLERFQKLCSRRRQSAQTDFMANEEGADSRPRLRDLLNCSRAFPSIM